jgi:hypothetical protein
LDMDMDKEGATLKNMKGSKFMDKRSTQVGWKVLMARGGVNSLLKISIKTS